MSIVVWDGRELAADSRLTYSYRIFRGTQVAWSRNSAAVKLLSGSGFLWGTHAVQAIGCVGSLRILRWLAMQAPLTNQPVDLVLPATYRVAKRVQWEFSLLVLTAEALHEVTTLHESGQLILAFNRLDRDQPFVMGTGHRRYLASFLKAGLSARHAASMARFWDSFTGGSLTLWDGSDILTNVRPYGLFSCIAETSRVLAVRGDSSVESQEAGLGA